MATNDEEKSKVTLADMALFKRSKLIFFVLNLALVIPYVVKNYSHWGLAGAIVLMLIAFYVIIIKPNIDAPASKDIPLLLFFDFCVYLVLSYQALIDNFEIQYLSNINGRMKDECFTLWVISMAISLFTPKRQSLVWLKSIGKTVAGAAVIMQFWSNGDIFEPIFYRGGDSFLAFYLLCSIAWYIFCVIACYVEPASFKRNNWLSNILLFGFFVLCTAENQIIQEFITGLKSAMLAIPTVNFAWWKVILSGVVLVGCAVVAYDYVNDTMGADSLVLGFTASVIVLLKVLMCNYFSFSWVVFLVFLVSSIRCLRNEQRQTKTLRLDSPVYLTVQFVVLLGAIHLIKAGLWINVIVLSVYTLIFYTTAGKRKNETHELRFWITILSAPAVYAIAYIWQMRFAMETVVMILLAFTVSVGAMIILNWPHPDKLKVPKGFKMLICLFMVLLCWISMGRYGAKVDIEFEDSTNTAVVEIEAKGKENGIETVEYYWSDISGEMIGSEKTMATKGAEIPIKGEKLTIVVTDINGVKTTKEEWYPDWLLSK